MKLTVQIKLIPSRVQCAVLLTTLELANKACNRLSKLAWDAKEFHRFTLHRKFYRQLRDEFKLSSQLICLLNAKVADSYKLDRKKLRAFRDHGSISYDSRVLHINLFKSNINIWTVNGRIIIPFICGMNQLKLLAYPHGEADLIYRNSKWYLNIVVEVPEDKEFEATDVLGVDMGIVEIAYDSDGNHYSGIELNAVRRHNREIRRKLQHKNTKSAKRLLKKRNRKEQLFAADTNHCISKRIVQTAKRTKRAIAIEDLKGIGARVRASKTVRTDLHNWGFAQLGEYIAYKAKLNGVPVIKIDPRNTSKQCSICGHTVKANRKSQSEFVCKQCGHTQNADGNAAENIRAKGLNVLGVGSVNNPNVAAISRGKIYDRTRLQA